MAHYSFTFENVDSAEEVNRITTALMMVDGVESVEVGCYGADVEGNAAYRTLLEVLETLGIRVSQR
ncbi:hypothetical protein [Aidingimonas lacisalsi]|uniref:hypothetical protein n=1 Tax=Aidingimonas lacisalsi TaxID=2604086 RepID=UPI0011D183AC|nr:hypothetical protein [Aidingimonas lacisalsi]